MHNKLTNGDLSAKSEEAQSQQQYAKTNNWGLFFEEEQSNFWDDGKKSELERKWGARRRLSEHIIVQLYRQLMAVVSDKTVGDKAQKEHRRGPEWSNKPCQNPV